MKQPLMALAAATILIAGPTLAAQQQDPPPTPPPAAKEAPAKISTSPAGKWTMSLDGPQGPMSIALEVLVDAKNIVTGTLNGPSGLAKIAGEVKEGVLEFSFSMDANGTPLEIWVEGKVDDEGKMAGMLWVGEMGSFPFKAERAKGL